MAWRASPSVKARRGQPMHGIADRLTAVDDDRLVVLYRDF
jgi:hypothetical protein